MTRTEIKFQCPKCQSNKIEEIQVNVTVATEIYNVCEHEVSVHLGMDKHVDTDQGDQTNEGGHVDRYQCGECGYTIVDDSSPHADDGLDEVSLFLALKELRDKAASVLSFNDLVSQIVEAYRKLGGLELAEIWNEMFPTSQVVYEGDSLFRVADKQPSPENSS